MEEEEEEGSRLSDAQVVAAFAKSQQRIKRAREIFEEEEAANKRVALKEFTSKIERVYRIQLLHREDAHTCNYHCFGVKGCFSTLENALKHIQTLSDPQDWMVINVTIDQLGTRKERILATIDQAP